MPEEETDLRTMQADRQPLSATDPRDDWLSDAADLDWFPSDEDGETGESARPRLVRGRGGRRRRPAGPAGERSLQQRRLVAVGVLLAVVVVAIVVIVVSSGGNRNPTTTPPVTNPLTTPSTASTTPPVSTPKKTSTAKTSSSTVKLPASGTIKNGDTGAAVAALQRALTRLGATGIKADGKFGAKTQDAVTAFQTQHKLTADGVVGAKTAAAINRALAQLGG